MKEKKSNYPKKVKHKPIRTFIKLGTCSRTYFYILNQEFGVSMVEEEQAVDPMAGGILQQGYQCGMLWGASLALAGESLRRLEDPDKAVKLSVSATRHLMDNFVKTTKSVDCYDITNVDWTDKKSRRKHFITGKFLSCFFLAQKWAPRAIQSAKEGLALDIPENPGKPVSCASKTVRMMGGSEQDAVLVSGFAGGLGLGGHACGALAAALWMKALKSLREKSGQPTYTSPEMDELLQKFYAATDFKMECHEICGKRFDSIEEHTDFINQGGCEKLIEMLASN